MNDEMPGVEFDADAGVYRSNYDWAGGVPLSTWIVKVVTHITDSGPTDLTPLHYCVDPDSLDRLFAPRPNGSARAAGAVSFELGEHMVTVDASGDVTIHPP